MNVENFEKTDSPENESVSKTIVNFKSEKLSESDNQRILIIFLRYRKNVCNYYPMLKNS